MPNSWYILSHMSDYPVAVVYRINRAVKLRPAGNQHFLWTTILSVNIKTFLNRRNLRLNRTCFNRRVFESNQAWTSSVTITHKEKYSFGRIIQRNSEIHICPVYQVFEWRIDFYKLANLVTEKTQHSIMRKPQIRLHSKLLIILEHLKKH